VVVPQRGPGAFGMGVCQAQTQQKDCLREEGNENQLFERAFGKRVIWGDHKADDLPQNKNRKRSKSRGPGNKLKNAPEGARTVFKRTATKGGERGTSRGRYKSSTAEPRKKDDRQEILIASS